MENKKSSVSFNILGEDYKITTDLDSETTLRIAEYVNKQIEETAQKVGYASLTKIAVLTALNIARDLFIENKNAEDLNERIADTCTGIEKVLRGE